MIGGEDDAVARLDPIFETLAPGVGTVDRAPTAARGDPSPGRAGLPPLRPERRRPLREDGAQRHRVRAHGRLRRGPERPAATPTSGSRPARAWTPRRRRCATPSSTSTSSTSTEIAEVWRRGSVIARGCSTSPPRRCSCRPASWTSSPGGCRTRARAGGRASPPSTRACPRHVLTAALYERFSSRGEADFADQVLSAMRFGFGGHLEKPDEADAVPTRSSSSAPPATSPTSRSSRRCAAWSPTGKLNVPVIGVAKQGWDLDQLKERAHDSLAAAHGIDRRCAVRQAHRAAALRRRRLQRRRRRSTSCASSSGTAQASAATTSPSRPSLFETVASGWPTPGAPRTPASWSRSRSATTWLSADELNADHHTGTSPRTASSASTTSSGKEPVQNLLYFRFANTFLEPIWNRNYVDNVADHDGRGRSASPTAARSTTPPAPSAT